MASRDDFGSGAPRFGAPVLGDFVGQTSSALREVQSNHMVLFQGQPTVVMVDPDHQLANHFRGPYVKRWNGSLWEQLGAVMEPLNVDQVAGQRMLPSNMKLATDGTDLFVAYTVAVRTNPTDFTINMVVRKWSGSSWTLIHEQVGASQNITGKLQLVHLDLAVHAGGWHVVWNRDGSASGGTWYAAHDVAANQILTTSNPLPGVLAGVNENFLRHDTSTPWLFTRVDFDSDTKGGYWRLRMMNPETGTIAQSITAPLWDGPSTGGRAQVGGIFAVSRKVTRGGVDRYVMAMGPPAPGQGPFVGDDLTRYTDPKILQVRADGSTAWELFEQDSDGSAGTYCSPRWASVSDINNPNGSGAFVQDDANGNLYYIANPVVRPARTALFRDACPGDPRAKEWALISHNTSGGFSQLGRNTFPPEGDPYIYPNGAVAVDVARPSPFLLAGVIYVNVCWGPTATGAGDLDDPLDPNNLQHAVFYQPICRGCALCAGVTEGLHVWARI